MLYLGGGTTGLLEGGGTTEEVVVVVVSDINSEDPKSKSRDRGVPTVTGTGPTVRK